MREPAAALNPLLPGVIERAKRVGMGALDFEADVASDDESGLDVMRCNLEGVVICTGPNKADSTYIRIPPGADAELVNQLSPLTDDPNFLMLDHGGTYEDKWFIKLKKGGLPAIKCRRADTMRAFWLTDEDCPVGYSLKRIATHLWKVPRVTWKEARRTKLPGMGPSFDDYGANDGLDTWNLWAHCEPILKREGLEKVFWDLEMGSRYAFSEMEYYGVPIDIPFLKSQMGGLKSKVMAARQAFDAVVGRPVNLGSSQDLAMALYYHLRLPVDPEFIGSKVARLNDIFPQGVPSTAELVLKKLKLNGHNQVDPVLEFRAAEKDLEFYEGLLRYAEANFGYCYPSIFTLLKTGRCAYSDPCLQQLPRPDKSELRKAVRAPDGQKWVGADLSQIELRIMAHMSGDATLVRAYKEGLDIHKITAAACGTTRQEAKPINFGFAYGLGWQKLIWMLLKDSNIVVDEATAREWRAAYFENYVGIQAYHEAVKAQIKEHGYVREMFGHYRRLKSLYKENRSKAERVGINFTIQAAAGSLLKIIMRNIRRRLIKEGLHEKVRMRLQVHDELGFTCDNDVADYTQRLVKEEMEGALTLPHPKTGEMMHWLKVPLMAGVGSGANWYEAK